MIKRISFILMVLALNAINLITLYSAVHNPDGSFLSFVFYKQIVWITLGWILAVGVSFINFRWFYDISIPFYGMSIFFLLLVIGLGKMHMGAQRWISVFGFNFQPSEIAKVAALLIMARTFSSKLLFGYSEAKKGFFSEIVIPFLPSSVLFLLIFIQPDLGTSLVIIFMYILLLLANKPRIKNLIIAASLMLMLIPCAWLVMKPYQKSRVLTFLNPERDPLGAGYTTIQSKIAIGSGQLTGRGFMAGTQNQFNFVPERHTDFIFSVFAEEWGFIGCLVLLFIFYNMMKMILESALRTKDPFAYNMCVGIFALFFIHMFINIAMVMGILPVVGLPLLFFSYGGSYMLLNFLLVGMYLTVLKEER